MKATFAPRIWQAPQLARYTRAVARRITTESSSDASHDERAIADKAVYFACGAPYGESPLAQWVWWEFGQWQTAN